MYRIDEGRVELLAEVIHDMNREDFDVPWGRVSPKYRRQCLQRVRDVLDAEQILAKRVADKFVNTL